MAPKFDILFCDWSGCISNDLLTVYTAHKRTLESFDCRILPLDEWRRSFVTNNFKEFYESSGVFAPMEEIDRRYRKFYDAVVREGIRPIVYPDAPAALERISKGVPIIVVSAQMQYAIEREAEEYGVKRFISKLCGDVRGKADFIAAEKGSRNAAFVEDMVQGIRAGKKAGVKTVAVTRGYHFEDMLHAEGADYYIDNLNGLENILF